MSAKSAGGREPRGRGAAGTEGMSVLQRRFPTIADLRRRARRRVPRFAFDFVDGGCGENEVVARNRAALDGVRVIPRYGQGVIPVTTAVELFGRRYAAPIGIAPMGLGSLIWPQAEEHLARAAQAANIPYVLATPGCAAIERIADLAPDVFWFQLYDLPNNDHATAFDLVRRAAAAGAQALVATIDTPVRAKRPQDRRNALAVPFRPTLRTAFDIATSPAWALEVLRQGSPSCANFRAYAGTAPSAADTFAFVQRELAGGFTWDTLARLRDLWPRAFLVKGIIHPDEAARAVELGADGIIVSNHGGRTFDAAPAAIDMLPSILARVAGRATVLADSGIRSGVDVVRALAVGATAVLAGRPFLYAVGALGAPGAAHAIDLFTDEIAMTLGQIGARNLAEAHQARVIHPAALAFEAPPAAAPTRRLEGGLLSV